jgi:hypothetical protein
MAIRDGKDFRTFINGKEVNQEVMCSIGINKFKVQAFYGAGNDYGFDDKYNIVVKDVLNNEDIFIAMGYDYIGYKLKFPVETPCLITYIFKG